MNLSVKTLKIIAIICFVTGIVLMLVFISYTAGTGKITLIPFLPVGISLTVIGYILIVKAKKKKEQESKGV
jgi:hypothetical protein